MTIRAGRVLRPLLHVALTCTALLFCRPAAGQTGSPAVDAPTDSPRASLQHFLDLCRAGRHAEAAAYLEWPERSSAQPALVARRLKAVLDHHVWFDLEKIASTPAGNPEDGLPAAIDEIARIPAATGMQEPVRLVRDPSGARWRFSTGTVERVDAWYAGLPNRWALDWLPPVLLRPGPGELLWWQWLGLPVLLVVAWGLGSLLGRLTRGVLSRAAKRTRSQWDDVILSRIGEPLALAWAIAAAFLLIPYLGLYQPAEDLLHCGLRAGLFAAFFWAVLRSIDIGTQLVSRTTWAQKNPSSRSLVPLGARVANVAVIAIGAVALLSELGYPVASLVAGLGIGGLAIALAAQKTVENLFGAFSIGADQPFREGDFVKIEDFVGTVEKIGLRSTRIRTLDRTIISLPNGKLADMRLESFSVRDRIRLACTIGLVYDTNASQMRQVLEGLEAVLRNHPKIWSEAVVVRFKEFGASSLDIEVMAWFETPDWGEFQLIRQNVLLQFMEVVESAGSSFAFPTRTVHVVGGSSSAQAVARG